MENRGRGDRFSPVLPGDPSGARGGFRVLLVLVVTVGFLASPGYTTGTVASNPGNEATGTELDFQRREQQNSFRPGERIKLRVTYLGLTGGYITAKVDRKTFQGKSVYRLEVQARSSGIASIFYSIRDTLVSYMDASGLFSWGYDLNTRHNGEKEREKVRYNHTKGYYVQNGKKKGDVPRYTQDLLSAVYYLRTQNFQVGQTHRYPVHVDDTAYTLVIRVDGVERVATKDGWKKAYRLIPTLQDPDERKEMKRKLKGNSNGVRLWVSTDKRKIPLKVSIPAKIGSFLGYLHSYSNGRDDGATRPS